MRSFGNNQVSNLGYNPVNSGFHQVIAGWRVVPAGVRHHDWMANIYFIPYLLLSFFSPVCQRKGLFARKLLLSEKEKEMRRLEKKKAKEQKKKKWYDGGIHTHIYTNIYIWKGTHWRQCAWMNVLFHWVKEKIYKFDISDKVRLPKMWIKTIHLPLLFFIFPYILFN